jgi:transcriptional regulator with XRE-family HTH domain
MTPEQIFALNVRQYLHRYGLTQGDLAVRMGRTSSYINNILQTRRCPTLRVVAEVADALGLEVWQLLRETEKTKKLGKKQNVGLTDDDKSE